jgi:hypothetical protein
VNKKAFKKFNNACALCGLSEYSLLDVHRIKEGEEYSIQNCVCLCCNCHRKHHSGLIKILSKHFSTSGWFLQILNENEEIEFKQI